MNSISCQTNGFSDQWASGPMGFRTNGFFWTNVLSDSCAFGPMGFRTKGLSEKNSHIIFHQSDESSHMR